VTLDSFPACVRCELITKSLATFGKRSDPDLLAFLPVVATNSADEMFAVARGRPNEQILRFSRTGQPLGRVGRIGDGPGEFRIVFGLFIDGGDSLYVVRDAYRIEVFAPTGQPIRSIKTPISGISGLAALGDGRLFIAGRGLTASSAGLPFHIIAQNGQILRSFGLPNPNPSELSIERHVVVTPSMAHWALDARNYRLDEMDGDGRLVRSIAVNAPWLRRPIMPNGETVFVDERRRAARANDVTNQVVEANRMRNPRRIAPPRSEIRALDVDGDSVAWVLMRVPTTRWREVPKIFRPGFDDEPLESDLTAPQLYDAILDVIRLRTGELAVRKVLHGVWEMPKAGRLMQLRFSPQDIVTGELFAVTVVPP
jgi:hypothetical protein